MAIVVKTAGHASVGAGKKAQAAAHQSTRNSGVLHCGVYYKPGWGKAFYRHSREQCKGHFAAVRAFIWNPFVKAHYWRRRENGKPKMVA